MKKLNCSLLATVLTTGLLLVGAKTQAQIVITEVDPNGSSASYAADWFELENIGSSTIDLTGWEMDDNSDSFSKAVALTGVTSIAAGQTVVFIENTDPNGSGGALLSPTATAALDANFANVWFGSNIPAGLTLANYGGSGVGLSANGDAVNIFDSTGNAITGVTFGVTTLGTTLDNTAGLSGAISQSSVVGVNGAFSDGSEVGSPGNVSPVPEPTTFALAGLGIAGLFAFRRNRKN